MHAHLALTVGEAAQALRVRTATIRGLIKSGELPAFAIGTQRGTRISLRALDGFISAHTFNVPHVDMCGHSDHQKIPQL
jgi:excisionase family DNA binding protein